MLVPNGLLRLNPKTVIPNNKHFESPLTISFVATALRFAPFFPSLPFTRM